VLFLCFCAVLPSSPFVRPVLNTTFLLMKQNDVRFLSIVANFGGNMKRWAAVSQGFISCSQAGSLLLSCVPVVAIALAVCS
jgi:hypothetical protein